MQKIRIAAVAVVCGIAILGGAIYLKSASKNPRAHAAVRDRGAEDADILRTKELLAVNNAEEAFRIIHQYEDRISGKGENARQWLSLIIEANMLQANFERLINLYEAYPLAFVDNEQASVMVADGYVLSKRFKEYGKIRDDWRERTAMGEMWLMLDADALLLQGQKDNALRILRSQKFDGKKDLERLVRLAFITSKEDPRAAWNYLTEAYNLDPSSGEIRSLRGKLLESQGQDSVALYEYISAVQANPNSVIFRDQLAEYYMRRNQIPSALAIWLETLLNSSPDTIWIKALFWSKVGSPVNFDWTKAVRPTDANTPFIDYLVSLPAGTFWNAGAFDRLSDGKRILSNLQASFWLRLLQALKDRDEKYARNLLQFNSFSQSIINPSLERALRQVLSYRSTGSLNSDKALIGDSDKSGAEDVPMPVDASPEAQSFFGQLNAFAHRGDGQRLPEGIEKLLKSDEAFAAVFLLAGWLEAALQLHQMDIIPADFPDWVAYGIAQALRVNRSPADALAFALKQTKTPAFSVLIGELYLASQKPDEVLATLKPFLADRSEIGYRASWLTSLAYLEKQDYNKAKEAIEDQPKLAGDPLGKEALARIALLQGDTRLADIIYSQIENESPEAMSYLARKAFANRDWARAQELTQKLIQLFPDNTTLRDNLNQILEVQLATPAALRK